MSTKFREPISGLVLQLQRAVRKNDKVKSVGVYQNMVLIELEWSELHAMARRLRLEPVEEAFQGQLKATLSNGRISWFSSWSPDADTLLKLRENNEG